MGYSVVARDQPTLAELRLGRRNFRLQTALAVGQANPTAVRLAGNRKSLGSQLDKFTPLAPKQKGPLTWTYFFWWPGTELNRRHGDFQSRCKSLY